MKKMNLSFYYACLLLSCLANYIHCQCEQRGLVPTTKLRDTIQGGVRTCREYVLGPQNNILKRFLIIFEASNTINCATDNVIIYDHRGSSVLNYCASRGQNPIATVFGVPTSRYLIVRYLNLGTGELTAGLDWFVLNDVEFSDDDDERPPPAFSTAAPAAPGGGRPSAQPQGNRNACGTPVNPMSNAGIRIVGGGPANPHSHPWQVLVTNAQGTMTCGGSIIDNRWVITAAHCTDDPRVRYRIVAGAHDFSSRNEGRISVNVTVFNHRQYDLTGRLENDIALLKLERPLIFNDKISPICLTPTATGPNVPVVTTGWGLRVDKGAVSNILHQVGLLSREASFCRSVGMSSSGGQICAGHTAASNNGIVKDSCQGDSGGPLIKQENGRWVLVGIVSYGGQSCNGIGVYTQPSFYTRWIEDTKAANN